MLQVSGETRRDWSPTLSQDSTSWNSISAAKVQGSGKKLRT